MEHYSSTWLKDYESSVDSNAPPLFMWANVQVSSFSGAMHLTHDDNERQN
jgi:hypothetical protein